MNDLILQKANNLFAKEKYEEALVCYKKAMLLYPDLVDIIQFSVDVAEKKLNKNYVASNSTQEISVDVIIPVYNALDDVKKCLQSLDNNADGFKVRVIVVNDGSDQDTTIWLREWFAKRKQHHLIEQDKNYGYTKAVNKGLSYSQATYIVIQNSDTIVTSGWLKGLVRCMRSSPSIGIVGPLSNAAMWQTVPELNDDLGGYKVNDIPNGMSLDEFAKLVKTASVYTYPRLPFINGFCFMIKQELIDKVGYMDDQNFPIGYGEEFDYCIRAAEVGYELAVADDVYVYHAKSKSFGKDRKKELADIGVESLKKKYGSEKYLAKVKVAKENNNLDLIRERVSTLINATLPTASLDQNNKNKNAKDTLKADHSSVGKESNSKLKPQDGYDIRFESSSDDQSIRGWCVNKSSRDQVFELGVYLDGSFLFNIKNDRRRDDLLKKGLSTGFGGFLFENPAVSLPEGQYSLAIKLPSGQLSNPIEIKGQNKSKKTDVKVQSTAVESVATPKSNAPVSSVYDIRFDATGNDAFVRGWSVNKKNRDEIFDLEVYLDGSFLFTIKNNGRRGDLLKRKLSGGLGGFTFRNPVLYLQEGQYSLTIKLPDGNFTPPLEANIEECKSKIHLNGDNFPPRSVTIIVPIYNAPDDVEVCIERLLEYTPAYARILLIDDCSPDARVTQILNKYKENTRISILFNEQNLGFTRTVNKGIAEAGRDDVIFLNSDARVTPGWLEGMLIAAISSPKIATVTAMSDRAGAFSAPKAGNDNTLPEGVSEITYARAFRRRSLGLYPEVPTGNGFCMFVSRDVIDSLGALDEAAFPRGYGEENEFCMRAMRAGWRNIIDDRTYVFHDRSKSFLDEKTALMSAGRAVVDDRYPEYKGAIKVFGTSEKIALARNRGQIAWQDCKDGWQPTPRVLFVISTVTGGTPQTNKDLMQALQGALDGWVFRCDRNVMELSRMIDGEPQLVRSHRLENSVEALTHRSFEYDAVIAGWLYEFDFDIVHIRHIAWHGLSLPRIAKQLGKKVVFSFHDFYVLTPTIKLIDDKGVYLGSTFLQEGSIYRESLWPVDSLPLPTGKWLDFWQERFQQELLYCDVFITTCESARALIHKYMPKLSMDNFFVIPHGRDFSAFYQIRQPVERNKPIRILVPGNITVSKGLEIIQALTEYDKEGKLEFHILGALQNLNNESNSKIVTHGTYNRLEFATKALAIKPHMGAVFSIWDETYCHTLTELWSVGLPVATFNFPNVADRVKRSGAGWVFDHKDIPKLYAEILRVGHDADEMSKVDIALAKWQHGYGAANTTRVMATNYFEIYRDLLRYNESKVGKKQLRVAVVCPGGSNLQRAPASTFIRIWERTRNVIDRDITYIRMTPATLLAAVREKSIDAAIIQRTAIPLNMINELLTAFSRAKIQYLLDLDDDLLNVPADKDPKRIYADYAVGLTSLIQYAQTLTVSTKPLLETMSKLNPRTMLLPNALSNRLWEPEPPLRSDENKVRVLYMGTATHDQDLNLILPALDLVAAKNQNFKVTLIGVTSQKALLESRKYMEIISIPESCKDYDQFVGWLRSQVSMFDFALAPLTNSAFDRSKSALKLLDCGALGLPVLASNVPNYQIGAPSVKLVENTTEAWVQALTAQVLLGKENRNQGKLLRQWVLKNHLLEQGIKEFDQVLFKMTKGDTGE